MLGLSASFAATALTLGSFEAGGGPLGKGGACLPALPAPQKAPEPFLPQRAYCQGRERAWGLAHTKSPLGRVRSFQISLPLRKHIPAAKGAWLDREMGDFYSGERGWKMVISRRNGFSSGLDPLGKDEVDAAPCLWRSVDESWPLSLGSSVGKRGASLTSQGWCEDNHVSRRV